MGIRCSRWVTMHGIGFNLNTELNRYSSIVPCGISDGDVTSLAEETGRSVDENEVQLVLLRHFADVFASDITIFERSDADAFLRTYLAPEALPVL
jgi:lipoyl(octanoyl) transferase